MRRFEFIQMFNQYRTIIWHMYACDFAKKLHSLVMFTKVVVYKCMGQANSKEVEKKEKKSALFEKFSCYKLYLYFGAMISHTHSGRCCQSFLTNPFFMKKTCYWLRNWSRNCTYLRSNLRRNSYYETRSC